MCLPIRTKRRRQRFERLADDGIWVSPRTEVPRRGVFRRNALSQGDQIAAGRSRKRCSHIENAPVMRGMNLREHRALEILEMP